MSAYRPLLVRYRDFLPMDAQTPILSLGEGSTPLVHAPSLAKQIGVAELWLKCEGMNPTGSFKDRGMVLAVAKAKQAGAKCIMCASTGNTSAAAAAYARRAGLTAIVALPAGNVSMSKMAQTLMYGAKLLPVDGNFDAAMRLVREVTDKLPIALVNSANPVRLEGQTTGAYEIVDDLGFVPDGVCLPVGNAGNLPAYWMGFQRYEAAGKSKGLPRMMGFEAEGCNAIMRGAPIEHPETIATAIRVGNPVSWKKAEAARDASGGIIDCVSDAQILSMWRDLANVEGVFCEPASAAGVAGLKKMVEQGRADKNGKYVAILTGHGLKDADNARKAVGEVPQAVKADFGHIREWLESHL